MKKKTDTPQIIRCPCCGHERARLPKAEKKWAVYAAAPEMRFVCEMLQAQRAEAFLRTIGKWVD